MRASLTVAAVATLIFSTFAATARADVAVTGPIEETIGSIASAIAGRDVSVRCETDADWAQLAVGEGFEPMSILGFVSFSGGRPADYAELRPDVCDELETFAGAGAKPTKCTPPAKTVRTRVVKVVRGRHVVNYVTQVVRAEAAQPVPCFAGGREQISSAPFWNGYFYVAQSLQTLVHESIHLKGDLVEAEAECYGMQWLAYAAQQLGDTADDAAAIAQYYVTRLYPQRRTQSPAYWSSECRANGRLDLTPNDGVWP